MKAAALWLLAGVVLGASAVTSNATADLGASLEQTKARASLHAAKHEGLHPLYKANGSGIVVWECWEAPAREWTKPQALSLARDLIPQALKTQTPRREKSKWGGEMLVYQDGTTVWLEYSSFTATYIGVAVWAREYKGPAC